MGRKGGWGNASLCPGPIKVAVKIEGVFYFVMRVESDIPSAQFASYFEPLG